MDCAATDACIEILDRADMRDAVMESIMSAIQRHLERRAEGAYEIGAVMFSNVYGLLGKTKTADNLLIGD